MMLKKLIYLTKKMQYIRANSDDTVATTGDTIDSELPHTDVSEKITELVAI